jgi:hypothetical protein
LGVFTMDNVRGRGLRNEAEVNYIIYALSIVNRMLISASHEIINLIPICRPSIPSEIRSYFEVEYKKYRE